MRHQALRFLLLTALVSVAACKKSKSDDKRAKEQVEVALPKADVVAAPREPAAGSTLSDEQAKTLTNPDSFVPEAYLASFIERPAVSHWYGFYMAGRKAGYAELQRRPTRRGEPGVYVIGLDIKVSADGEDMSMSESTYYAGPPSYEILLIETREAGGTGSVQRRFTRDDDKTIVETIIDGEKAPDSWAPSMCGSLATEVATMAPDRSVIQAGTRGAFCNFSSSDQRQEISELRVASIETRRVEGIEVSLAKLEQKDGDSNQWVSITITEDGTSLEVALGEGISLRLEDKEVAQSDVVGIDIMSSAIKVARPLGDPTQIKELRLKARFIEGFAPPASTPNQEVEKQADGSYHLTIRSVPGAKVLADEREKALAATAEVNSDDPTIIALAKKLTASAKSRQEKIAVLNHWVYGNLDKSLSTNLSTASQVLEHKTGDCTEHTLLLLALLRSLQIPARELAGLVYADGDFSAFGWHAWTEVEIDGHWVQVDPSWDEVIGNATHVKLGGGDSDDSMYNIGSMSLEVL